MIESVVPRQILPAVVRFGIFAMVLVLAGCIGGQEYSGILEEAERRGGGAEAFLVREAEAAVAERLAVEPGSLVLASVTIAPAGLDLVLADPHTPGNWDKYRYANRQLQDASPVGMQGRIPPGFRLGEFQALDRLPELVADARDRIGFAEGSLLAVRIRPAPIRSPRDEPVPGPRLHVSLSDPRQGTGVQEYDAAGRPL